ncbi:MAG TPA: VOC family protein [Microbacterium sp.]|nr:VOC family protein [Microbacterium sp.]
MPEPISAQQFHAHDGLEPWRVLFTGAHAHWRTASLAEGGRFVAAIAASLADLDRAPDIDLRPRGVVVRTSGPEFALDALDVLIAQRVTAAAAELALVPDPAVLKVVNVNVARHPDVDVRPFWNAALGYDDLWESDAVDPNGRGPQLAFNDIDRRGRGRTHIDVSVPAEVGETVVRAALAAGGRLVDERPGMWWTLASPENHGVDIAIWPDTAG